MFILQGQKLTDEVIASKDADFFEAVLPNPEVAEQAQDELANFFQPPSSAKVKEHYLTYFRWYTELTWKRLRSCSNEFLVKEAVARQIPMALLLGVDVQNELTWYFVARAWIAEEMQILYADIRETILNSEAFIGSIQGKDYLMKDLVEDVKKLNLKTITSLESAEINAKIKNAFFPKNDQLFDTYITADPDVVVDHAIGLINFILGVEPKNIWYVVDGIVHPFEFVKSAVEENTTPVVPETTPPPQAEQVPAPPTTPVIEAKPVAKPATAVAPTPKPTYLDIQLVAQSKFKQGDDGQFEDPEAVLGMLEEWATKYNDDTIRELYVYNEQTGAFEWNEALLK